jgi:methyl-galactoside transport system substrate-binding protein
MNKHLKLLTFGSIALLTLASCSSSSSGEVGIFIYDKADTFMGSLANKLMQNLSDSGLTYDSVFDAGRSQTTQNQDFIGFLNESSSKAMVVNTVDRLASSALIEKAETKNKPIVFINREPLKEDLTRDSWSQSNCFYVGADSSYEGTLQASIADKVFGGAASFANSAYDKNKDGIVQVLIFKGELGHQDAEARTKNCLTGLSNLGYAYSVIETSYCNWERSVAYSTMKSLYSDSIELLFCNNDDMALGAIDYLKEKAKTDTSLDSSLAFDKEFFPIVGVDATSAGRDALTKGYLSGTVLNDGAKQSYVITGLLKYLINNESFPTYESSVSHDGNMYYVKGSIVEK